MESFIRLLMVSFAMDNLSLVKTRMLFVQLHSLKNNPHEVIDRIAKGVRSWVDVGVITVANGEPQYFINVADIHLSAKAGYYASRYKRFGKLCYVIGALQAFLSHQNQDLRLKILMMVSEKCTPKVLLELNPCLAKYSVFCGLNSALHFAAPKGHNEIVTLLLENGVVVNSRNYCRQIQFKYMIWCYHIWGDIMWKTETQSHKGNSCFTTSMD